MSKEIKKAVQQTTIIIGEVSKSKKVLRKQKNKIHTY